MTVLKTFSQNSMTQATSFISYVYKCKYQDPVLLQQSLSILFPSAKVSSDPLFRQLTIKGSKSEIKQIRKLLRKWDNPLPQIKIEVKVVEVTDSTLKENKPFFTEISSGLKVNYDFSAQKLTSLTALDGLIQTLIQKGKAKILAKPTLSTLDNHAASIKIGDQWPYVSTTISDNNIQTTHLLQLDTGIELGITPKITHTGAIETKIETTISTIKLWKEIKLTEYPVLSTRTVRTNVRIPNQKTLVIAGLFQEQEKVNHHSVPILSRIPLLGRLFKGKSEEVVRSDVMIFITPVLI